MQLREIKNIFRTPLCESQSLADFTQNIQTMLQKKNFLYRGMKMHDGMVSAGIPDTYAYIITPREEPRTAKGSAIAAAIAENWTDLPPRNKSSFATGEASDTRQFGITHLVVPADSANSTNGYGVAQSDFNFSYGVDDLRILNTSALDLYNYVEVWALDATGDVALEARELLDAVPMDKANSPRPVFSDPRTLAFYDYLLGGIDTTGIPSLITRLISKMQNELNRLGVRWMSDILTKMKPADFGITHAKTLADIPANVGEVWWDKPYLAIAMDSDTPEECLQRALDAIKVMK